MCCQHWISVVVVGPSLLPVDLGTPGSSEAARLKCSPDVCSEAAAKPSVSKPSSSIQHAKASDGKMETRHRWGQIHADHGIANHSKAQCITLHNNRQLHGLIIQTARLVHFHLLHLQIICHVIAWFAGSLLTRFQIVCFMINTFSDALKCWLYHFTMERRGCWVVVGGTFLGCRSVYLQRNHTKTRRIMVIKVRHKEYNII